MRLRTFMASVLLVSLFAGCNTQNAPEDDATLDVPDWLSKEEDSAIADERSNSDRDFSSSKDEAPEGDEGSSVAAVDATRRPLRTPNEPRGELKLQLQPQEQFPLRKQVITTLVQTASDGTEQRIQTDLRLLMAITVEEVAEGRTRLGVVYRRVDFEQTMDGQKLTYHSTTPPIEIPLVAQAYHDMVNDGFSFWIGKDNQINEVVGFQEFLGRCLRNVPPTLQKQVLLGMEAGADENGISDFVDNTIGLLPFGQNVAPGQEWVRHRNVGRPIPMVVQNRYTLQDLTPAEAVVKISGEIIPSATINKVNHTQQDDINVSVLGGQTTGQCTIFRDTGLPKESHTERVVNMTVDLGNGHVFNQTKTVITRVEAFPTVRDSK